MALVLRKEDCCWKLTLPRIAMQLGLRDLVVNQCSNFNCTSMLPPRMLPLPNTLIDQEEKTRAYWMTEILDGSSTMGVAWNVSLTRPPPPILPSVSTTTSTNSTSSPYEQNMPWLAFGNELWTTMPEFYISVALQLEEQNGRQNARM